ncbi:MAG: hypothetical protein OEV06_10725, partial [Anaerolineae bacterium]|nr:hypothetical protein [Anaerolineae bacterium]
PTSLHPGTFTDAFNAAHARSISNGYDNDDSNVTVGVNVGGPFTDNGIYYLVRVTITSQLETTFAHLVYDGPLVSTVYAIAKARPPQNLAFGYAIYGVSNDACNTINFTGNNNVNINGGGIFSNSTANSSSCASMSREGNGNVNVSGGAIGAVGNFYENGAGSISPTPTEYVDQQTLPDITHPDCSGMPNYGDQFFNSGGTVTIDPGNYNSIRVGAGTDVIMNPGMYCIVGEDGFTGNGGDITGSAVFIYMQDGPFDLGGNARIRLGASTNLVDPSGNQWAGMLLYMHHENHEQVILTGSSATRYRGTVYAPGPTKSDNKIKCIVEGTAGEIGVSSQLICYTVKLTGNANINLKYNAGQNYQFPASLGLQE